MLKNQLYNSHAEMEAKRKFTQFFHVDNKIFSDWNYEVLCRKKSSGNWKFPPRQKIKANEMFWFMNHVKAFFL